MLCWGGEGRRVERRKAGEGGRRDGKRCFFGCFLFFVFVLYGFFGGLVGKVQRCFFFFWSEKMVLYVFLYINKNRVLKKMDFIWFCLMTPFLNKKNGDCMGFS